MALRVLFLGGKKPRDLFIEAHAALFKDKSVFREILNGASSQFKRGMLARRRFFGR
jgi:hypothetical protein